MASAITVDLPYGKSHLSLALDPKLAEWHVVRSVHRAGLVNARGRFETACRAPIGAAPLREMVKPDDRVVIVTSDGTRAFPNRVIVPWLLEELGIPSENVTILVGTGSHRPNTEDELTEMFGAEICRAVRVVNHDAFDPERNIEVDAGVLLDADYVRADKRIALGFVEPHFFAGFSGGAKAVVPGVAGIETIFTVHSRELIAHPKSTWGCLEGNPLHETILEMVAACPPDFLINVALNNEKQITDVFAGHYVEAHRAGCERVRECAMAAVAHRFPIVVTSNSGYPLDQNLYQSVKGMSAAAKITQDGGTIFMASECSDGVPEHGNFGKLLREPECLDATDRWLREMRSPVLDQWQVQVLAQILQRNDVHLYSGLDAERVRRCRMTPVESLESALREQIGKIGSGAPVAVLPDGPLTIPYVAD